MKTRPPMLILGSGGHASVLADILLAGSEKVLGFTDPCPAKQNLLGLPWLGDDEYILKFPVEGVLLVNGIGSVGHIGRHRDIFEKYKNLGYSFARVAHPTSIISPNATVSEGSQVMAGAIIQVGSKIGLNTIINTRVSVDHDCVIGDHTHLAPGVTLSGNVHVGNSTHIGTGAVVIQGIHIGQNCVIGAGAVVLKDVPDGSLYAGLPAKSISL